MAARTDFSTFLTGLVDAVSPLMMTWRGCGAAELLAAVAVLTGREPNMTRCGCDATAGSSRPSGGPARPEGLTGGRALEIITGCGRELML